MKVVAGAQNTWDLMKMTELIFEYSFRSVGRERESERARELPEYFKFLIRILLVRNWEFRLIDWRMFWKLPLERLFAKFVWLICSLNNWGSVFWEILIILSNKRNKNNEESLLIVSLILWMSGPKGKIIMPFLLLLMMFCLLSMRFLVMVRLFSLALLSTDNENAETEAACDRWECRNESCLWIVKKMYCA